MTTCVLALILDSDFTPHIVLVRLSRTDDYDSLLLLSGGLRGACAGKKSELPGRTEVWKAVVPAAPDGAVRAGFEGFRLRPDRGKILQCSAPNLGR